MQKRTTGWEFWQLRSSARRWISLFLLVLMTVGVSAGAYAQEETPPDNQAPTEFGGVPELALLAQTYPQGLHPFLVKKPFQESAAQPLWVNSVFDHKLPTYSEGKSEIPSDLRDTTEEVIDFLNHSYKDQASVFNCTKGYNCYSKHNGIDYQLNNQQVIAPADGVIRIGRESGTCRVWIEHDASVPRDNTADFSTEYLHLSGIGRASEQARATRDPAKKYTEMWSNGDRIRAGEVIGVSGSDPCGGKSTGSHLHFSVYRGGYDAQGKQVLDPFGWWGNVADPWADTRLGDENLRRNKIYLYPGPSLWAWSPPRNSSAGQPGYWGDGIGAQTDNEDASFHRFGPFTRRQESVGWRSLTPDPAAGVMPVGSSAWLSRSIETDTAIMRKNWAVWALHVPGNGQYRIQVHLPKAPTDLVATQNAVYSVYIPKNTSVTPWNSRPVDQRANNEWKYLYDQGNNSTFILQANTIVLVALSDVTGVKNEAVLFDAVRLEEGGPIESPIQANSRNVGFAIDNSSSMVEQGKLNVVKSNLSGWIDSLSAEGLATQYAIAAFADNVAPIKTTNTADQVKTWISQLSGNDNGRANYDCPEEQLKAIQELAPFVAGGQMLLFTDDLPKNFDENTGAAYRALKENKVKLHAITLPKTCNFGPGNDPLGWLSYRFLALFSGGTYQSVTTDKTAQALEIVLSEMRSHAQLYSIPPLTLNSSANSMQLVAEKTHPITVDSSVTRLNVLVNTFSGSFSLSLIRPDGSTVSMGDLGVTFIDSGSALYYQIASPTPGVWQAVVSGDGEYALSVSADTPIQFAYLGDTRAAPNQLVLLAARISGPVAAANFQIRSNDGAWSADVVLHDDGQGADFTAGDGLYLGTFLPTQVGDYIMTMTGTTETGSSYERTDSRIIRVQGVSVEAPQPVTAVLGEPTTLTFTISNHGPNSEIYDLILTADQPWVTQEPPANITVPAGGTIPVNVLVTPPAEADLTTGITVWLVARSQSDTTIYADDAVMIFTPDPGVPYYPVYIPAVQR